MQVTSKRPPKNALSVDRWNDLPNRVKPASYLVVNGDGSSRTIYASKNLRRVLEALTERQVYCASRCRISEYVRQLRDDLGIEIETDRYPGNPASGAASCGVYRLTSRVTRIDRKAVQQ